MTCTVAAVPTPGADPPEHPGVASPSVEIALRMMESTGTPSDAAVASRNDCAKAMAAGLVAISSGVSRQSSKAVGCSEAANSSETCTPR